MAQSAPVWAVTFAPSEQKLKEEFAELLLRRPKEAFEVAQIISDDDFALSFVRSKAWPNDPYVKLHQKKLLEQFGEEYFLPSKAEMFHHLWARVALTGPNGVGMEDRDYIAGMRLALETRHFVGKFGEQPGGGNSVNNTVILQFVKPDETPNTANNIKTIDGDYAATELAPLNIEFK